jgi:hypothetical protein
VQGGKVRRAFSQAPTQRDVIQSQRPMTRFSYAWGPLCRWPWLSPDEVRLAVERELERMARRVI